MNFQQKTIYILRHLRFYKSIFHQKIMSEQKYAEGVISVQIRARYRGKEGHILAVHPDRPEGWSWVGGEFPATGSFHSAIEQIVEQQTGASILLKGIQMKKMAYSFSPYQNKWIVNSCFFVDSNPLEDWSPPQNRNFRVALFDTRSFGNFPDAMPEKIYEHHGHGDETFRWGINDGGYIGKRVASIRNEIEKEGRDPMYDLPFVNIKLPRQSNLGWGHGLNVGSVVIPHSYKDKRGRVLIKNRDSEYLANVGGKVEIPKGRNSDNADVVGCVLTEAGEEIGVSLRGVSIVGTSITPWDLAPSNNSNMPKPPEGINSILNTCIRARAIFPDQLDEAIENPQKFIPEEEKEKIEGIYFLPNAEYQELLSLGRMRTRDMIPLSEKEYFGCPVDRPSLESIDVVPRGEYAANFIKETPGTRNN